jgi:hypothetical protein
MVDQCKNIFLKNQKVRLKVVHSESIRRDPLWLKGRNICAYEFVRVREKNMR